MKSNRLFWRSLASVCLPGIALLILLRTPYAHYSEGCGSTNGGPIYCTKGPLQYDISASLILGLVLLVIGFVSWVLAWLSGLSMTVRVRQWGWFVVILILSPLATLLYSFKKRERPAA